MAANGEVFTKKRSRKIGRKIAFYAGVIFLFVISIFPIAWMIMTAFKPEHKVYEVPPPFIFQPTLANFRYIFTKAPIPHYLFNTVIVATLATGLSLAIGLVAAYSLARFRFKGKDNIAFYILSIRMFPPVAAAIPIFLIMRGLRLLDTKWALVIAYLTFNLPFVVWMLRSFIEAIPHELEEAAMVDGRTRMQAFRQITLPLLLPSIAAVAIFCFIFSWNEFLFALVLTRRAAKTLPLGLTEFITFEGIGWHHVFATAFILVVPVIIFSILMQKYLVKGLTMGAVRG
ncbi:carbohydrate ABC transporter permease [Candidatus Aerophobetes bacterium]|nr:carbohydrate ABC transporter permease [Candidatus Aerophobetes bacterium]